MSAGDQLLRGPVGLYAATLDAWEKKLGDPTREGVFSFHAAARHDEDETLPRAALDALVGHGASVLQVPIEHGGTLSSLEQLIAASYAIGRRDPTLALVMGLRMWSQLVWMAGNAAQRSRIGALLQGGGAIALAASEAEHGADLLSTQTIARPTASGYTLHGRKWPIGSARHADVVFVLARTKEERGPRSLSWFLLDAKHLADPRVRRSNKIPTLGFRAADLGALEFDGVELSSADMVGAPGAGLELALKLFQITRPLVASLSLGPADTALRLAAEFVLNRTLYSGAVTDLPAVRRALTSAWTSFLVAEVVNVAVVRGAHRDPGALDVGSLTAKIVVPELARRAIERAAATLGARFFLRDHAQGTFQKLYRDQSVVSIFDGSTDVCLQLLANQLPLLCEVRPAPKADHLHALLALTRPVPPLSYEGLELVARGGDSVLASLASLASPASPASLASIASPPSLREVAARPAAAGAAAAIHAAIDRLENERTRLEHALRTLRANAGSGAARTAEMADLAALYARLHALALCTAAVALAPEDHPGLSAGARAAWLWSAAAQLLGPLAGSPPVDTLTEELFPELERRTRSGALYSFFSSREGP